MARKDFDNLYKVIEVAVVYTGNSLVSIEVDFDIPSDHIVKIFRIELRLEEFPSEDFEGISVDKLAQLSMVLIKDPDDTATQTFTSNRVQHDVIADFEVDILIIGGTAGDPGIIIFPQNNYVKEIPEHIDLITARNMRFNAIAEGTDAADITETLAVCQIEYTLEKVSDDLLINILDIL